MSAARKADLKRILREECLPLLGGQSRYYSAAAIKGWLQKRKLRCPPATLSRYLHAFTRAGLVFASGRGWYSSLATPFTLNREPVLSLVQQLSQTFPLLEFSCWSTEQIASYGHHLLAKFAAFVHTERDAMESVFEFLRDQGYDAHLNPRGPAARQLTVRERTVVVRPRVTTQPAEEHFVTIEGLLVDLFVEGRDLGLMDSGEYFQVFRNAARAGRIMLGGLTEYAGKRTPATSVLLESINRGFSQNPLLIDSA
jgi:hypothetical protein